MAFVRALSAEQFNVNLIAVNTRLLNSTLSAGGSLQASARSVVAGRDNVAILGVEYVNSQVKSRTFEEASGAAQTLEADVADNQNAVGVYAQDSLAAAAGFTGPGSSFVLTAAARWDYLRHDIDDRLGGPSSGVFSYNRVNPRAGVNLNLSERLGFYASYSQGYRAPAFLELTCAGPGAVCPGLQVGVAPDPPLKAVTATNYEVGMQARPFPWLDIDVSVYRTDVSDDIFSVSPTGTTGVFFQNVGQTRREGVEVGLRGAGAAALDGYVNYAYTRATFQDRVELATPLPPGLETVPAGSSLTHRAPPPPQCGPRLSPSGPGSRWRWTRGGSARSTFAVTTRTVSRRCLATGRQRRCDRPLARLRGFRPHQQCPRQPLRDLRDVCPQRAHAGGAGGALLDPGAPDQCPGRPPLRVLGLRETSQWLRSTLTIAGRQG